MIKIFGGFRNRKTVVVGFWSVKPIDVSGLLDQFGNGFPREPSGVTVRLADRKVTE